MKIDKSFLRLGTTGLYVYGNKSNIGLDGGEYLLEAFNEEFSLRKTVSDDNGLVMAWIYRSDSMEMRIYNR